jgi:hypothetical protein
MHQITKHLAEILDLLSAAILIDRSALANAI